MKRYVFEGTPKDMQEHFEVASHSDAMISPNYNAAPGNKLPVIISDNDTSLLISGVWSKDKPSISIANLESTNSEAFMPCIIPASGFYAWKSSVDDPYPFYIRIHTRELIGIAGILQKSESKSTVFSVITAPANVLVQPLTDTMPAILSPVAYQTWLHAETESKFNLTIADNSILSEMTVVRVPELVNDLSNNSKALIQPIPKLREDD